MRGLLAGVIFIAGAATGLLFGGHVHPALAAMFVGAWLTLAAVFVGMVAPAAIRQAQRNAAIEARRAAGDNLSRSAAYQAGYSNGRQAERTHATHAERARWHVPAGEVTQ